VHVLRKRVRIRADPGRSRTAFLTLTGGPGLAGALPTLMSLPQTKSSLAANTDRVDAARLAKMLAPGTLPTVLGDTSADAGDPLFTVLYYRMRLASSRRRDIN
jgi:hypothetical protein